MYKESINEAARESDIEQLCPFVSHYPAPASLQRTRPSITGSSSLTGAGVRNIKVLKYDALSSYFTNNLKIELLLEPKIQNVNNEECFLYTGSVHSAQFQGIKINLSELIHQPVFCLDYFKSNNNKKSFYTWFF